MATDSSTSGSRELVSLQDLEQSSLSELGRSVLGDTASIAKRLNNDIIGHEHFFVAVVRNLALDSATPLTADQAKKFKALIESDIWDRRAEFKIDDDKGSQLHVDKGVVSSLEKLAAFEADSTVSLLTAEADRLPDDLHSRVLELLENPEPDPVRAEPDDGARDAPAADTGTTAASDAKTVPNVPFSIQAAERLKYLCPISMPSWHEKMELLATALQTASRRTVVIHGRPGSGCRTFLRNFVADAVSGRRSGLEGVSFHFLDFNQVRQSALSDNGIPTGIVQCVERISALDDAVLVIENADLLLQPMVTMPGSILLNSFLADGRVRVLMACSDKAYRSLFPGASSGSGADSSGGIFPVSVAPGAREDVVGALKSYAAFISDGDWEITDECCDALLNALPLTNHRTHDLGAAFNLLEEILVYGSNHIAKTVHPELIGEYMRLRSGGQQVDVLPGLRDLERRINDVVLDQDEAVSMVVRRLKQTKLKLDQRPERPDGVFLFVGPSGVGKTLLAKALCQCLYGSYDRLIRIDMSEYLESHSIAKLIGSPPGYVGYGEQPALTGPAAKMGEGVILLDEVEKAHPKVLNLFLQLFDEGFITDSAQNKVMFSDFVVIMTSNLGKDLWEATTAKRRLGFDVDTGAQQTADDPSSSRVIQHLLKVVPSEFVNRIDEVVPFRSLTIDQLRNIAGHMLEREQRRWEDRFGKKFLVTPAVADHVGGLDYMPALGARHLERNIERYIVREIAELALSPEWQDVNRVEIAVTGSGLKVTAS